MQRVRLGGLIVVLAVLLGGPGCLDNAPRDNPLDPLSGAYRDEGAVAGRVTRFYSPYPGLAGARVRLVPAPESPLPELVATTDAEGRFLLSGVRAGSYAVLAERPGFAGDADTVTVRAGALSEIEVRLDALPVVTAQSLRSVRISRWWPTEDLLRLEVEVDVEDPDGPGDVDRVWLSLAELSYADTLHATQTPGRFAGTIPAGQLPGGQIHTLVGRAFRVRVRDHAGRISEGAPLTLIRMIDQVPLPVSPQGFETVSTPRPLMVWEPQALPFPFTYRVSVVRVDPDVQTTVLVVGALAPSATSLMAPQDLPPGSYFWTVSVVDGYGNSSRSKEAGFNRTD
jgi:hypothetical protein